MTGHAGSAAGPASSGAHEVSVLCRPTVDGFACEVVVGPEPGVTHHAVSVSKVELARLAPGHFDPGDLVAASFDFLLAREPRQAILPRFALSVIERYFPGYEATMRARFARDPGSSERRPS